jgi:hypothetical protein
MRTRACRKETRARQRRNRLRLLQRSHQEATCAAARTARTFSRLLLSMEIAGKTVVVTGGARGLGFASARACLERGARVVIGARHERSLATAVERLDGGDRVAAVVSNVATVAGCRAVADAALAAFGALDVLFTNAGTYATADVEEMSEELWDSILDSNLKATFFCIQAALPALSRARGAVVTGIRCRLGRRSRGLQRLRGRQGRHRQPHPAARTRSCPRRTSQLHRAGVHRDRGPVGSS